MKNNETQEPKQKEVKGRSGVRKNSDGTESTHHKGFKLKK